MGVGAGHFQCLDGEARHHSRIEDMPTREKLHLQLSGKDRCQEDETPLPPELALPSLPNLVPGKPLDQAQRNELLVLQQQIRAQLSQQRVLVQSIRSLPQFREPRGPAQPQLVVAETAERVLASLLEQDQLIERMMAVPQTSGRSAGGDSPIEDADAEDGDAASSAVAPAGETRTVSAEPSNKPPTSDVAAVQIEKQPHATGQPLPTLVSAEPDGRVAHLANAASKSVASGDTSAGAAACVGNATDVADSVGQVQSIEPLVLGPDPSSGATIGGTDNSQCIQLADSNVAVSASAASSPKTASKDVTGLPVAVPPLKERTIPAMIPALTGQMVRAEDNNMGNCPPGREERRWIEAAVRRMFRSLTPSELDTLIEAFREWKLPPCAAIVKQGAPISTGPGLCVLYIGVVDVLHCPKGGSENEKVCTYDRCGQCFGELELFFDAPRGMGGGRKSHWATIATRTPATLWTVSRNALRGTGLSRPPTAELTSELIDKQSMAASMP